MIDPAIPRRIRIDLMTPAELAIRNAVLEVENAGCHVLLTDAVVLLQQAREKVADFVDANLEEEKFGKLVDGFFDEMDRRAP